MVQRRIPESSGGGGAVPTAGVEPGGGWKAHNFDFRPFGGQAGYFYASAPSFTEQYGSTFLGTGDTAYTVSATGTGMLSAIQAIGSISAVTQSTAVYPYVTVLPGASPSYYFGSGPIGLQLSVNGSNIVSAPDLPIGVETGATASLNSGDTLNFSFAAQPGAAVSMKVDSDGSTSQRQAAPLYGMGPEIRFGMRTPAGGSVQAGNGGGFLSMFVGLLELPADTVYNPGIEFFTQA